jgi:hypothetical protein
MQEKKKYRYDEKKNQKEVQKSKLKNYKKKE